MPDFVVIDIHDGEGIDVVALALGLGADRLGFLDGRETERKVGRRYRAVRIVEQRERNAPMGDGAVSIGFQRLLEHLLGLPVPE